MDDFARMMAEMGVRRIDEAAPPKARRAPTRRTTTAPALAPAGAPEAQQEAAPDPAATAAAPETGTSSDDADMAPAAWHAGPSAVRAVQTALTRILVETGSIHMVVRRDGALDLEPQMRLATVAELAARADAVGAELVMIDGPGWKLLMHPGTGVATLVDDLPSGTPE